MQKENTTKQDDNEIRTKEQAEEYLKHLENVPVIVSKTIQDAEIPPSLDEEVCDARA
ncbi:MAG TPA: hypothetical protein VF648_07020 [Pyrinomonadaceae bacterium]|jgi:hypothetical protein